MSAVVVFRSSLSNPRWLVDFSGETQLNRIERKSVILLAGMQIATNHNLHTTCFLVSRGIVCA